MAQSLKPKKIFLDFVRGDLTRQIATELLVSLIEKSDNEDERADCLKIIGEINSVSDSTFKILENSLLSDESPIVRSVASKAIIQNNLESGIKALKWSLRHEKSPLVLKSIIDLLGNIEDGFNSALEHELLNWISNFASKIGVIPEEAKFFLDLEALFAKTIDNYMIDSQTYRFYKKLAHISKNESWLVIKNKHVEILSFNWSNWRFLKENPSFLDSVSRLSYPSLFLNTLIKYSHDKTESLEVPDSISFFTHLKILDLSRNNLQAVPNSICSLPLLRELDLSRNDICKIPESLKLLHSLKVLNLSRNCIRTIPDSLRKFTNSLAKFEY